MTAASTLAVFSLVVVFSASLFGDSVWRTPGSTSKIPGIGETIHGLFAEDVADQNSSPKSADPSATGASATDDVITVLDDWTYTRLRPSRFNP